MGGRDPRHSRLIQERVRSVGAKGRVSGLIREAQFQNSIRISRAQDLLSSSDLSVSEIAAQTGFDSVYYFSRHFKQSTGLTPKAYRSRSCPH